MPTKVVPLNNTIPAGWEQLNGYRVYVRKMGPITLNVAYIGGNKFDVWLSHKKQVIANIHTGRPINDHPDSFWLNSFELDAKLTIRSWA